jgi:hypothetical protein
MMRKKHTGAQIVAKLRQSQSALAAAKCSQAEQILEPADPLFLAPKTPIFAHRIQCTN